MKLIEIAAPDFNLETTLDSGQVFHWEKWNEGFAGTIGDTPLYIEQCGKVLRIGGEGARDLASSSAQLVRRYFALDHPLADICRSFPGDPAMNEAREFCRGLRIIRQPRWECLASFIASSMKQVAHIRQISHALRRTFGEERQLGDHLLFTFPTAEQIAQTSEADLRRCALGYRAKNLLATARLVASGAAELDAWTGLPDSDLRERLCQLPGVGAKVANCVMLFAFERLQAFPIDVWIGRVLRARYFARKKKVTGRQLREFAQDYFGKHGGYAQQYLFHHARKTSRKTRACGPLGNSAARPRARLLRGRQIGQREQMIRNLSLPHL